MKINPAHKRTYAGCPAKLVVAAVTSSNRKLFAIRTASGTVATECDSCDELRRFAARKFLVLTVE